MLFSHHHHQGTDGDISVLTTDCSPPVELTGYSHMGSKIAFSLMILSSFACAQAASAQPLSEPAWPQHFDAFKGEPAAYGFVVTQPGPISVSVAVQSSPAPVLVTLSGPLAQPIQQQGTGTVHVAYVASAADVQRGYLWLVHVDSMNAPTVVQGTVSVSHPPADMNAAGLQIQALGQRIKAERNASRAANSAKAQQAFAAHEQALQQAKQQLASAQALRTQQLLKSIGAPGVQTRGVPTLTAATVRPSSTMALPVAGTPVLKVPPPPPPPPPPPTPPTVTSLSVGEGQPGDPVLITGTAFTSTGEVHFLVNPGMDLVAAVDFWSNTQIVAHVPTATGIQRYGGQMYVKANNQTSALQPFIFDPTLASQTLGVWRQNAPDSTIAGPTYDDNGAVPGDPNSPLAYSVGHFDSTWGWCSGHRADDQWHQASNLNNGWVVDSAYAYDRGDGSEGSYVSDNRPGTPSLYTKVHWWEDAQGNASYFLVITIKGPIGTSPF
jgi:hypothetical protein